MKRKRPCDSCLAHKLRNISTAIILYKWLATLLRQFFCKEKRKCCMIFEKYSLENVVATFNNPNGNKDDIFKATCKYILLYYMA